MSGNSVTQPSDTRSPAVVRRSSGIALAVTVGLLGYWVGSPFPLIGGPVMALVLGITIRLFWVPAESLQPGLKLSQKLMLQSAIVLSGAGLTVSEIWSSGIIAMPLILVTILVGLLLIPFAGRVMGLDRKVTQLVAVGTAICGATAIGAVTPVIGATAAQMAYAVSTIFLFNTLAVVIYPLLGHLSGFTDWMFGLWSGAAVHDTSSVVAAAYAFSDQAGDHATVVKLARTTMLVPVMLLYGFLAQGEKKPSLKSTLRSFPQFVIWFAVAAAINSAGLIPSFAAGSVKILSKIMMVVALAAVGLNTDFGTVKKIGIRPMLLGLGGSVLIGGVSWLVIQIFYG